MDTLKKPLRIMITGTNGFVGRRALELYPDAVRVPSKLVRNADEQLLNFVQGHNPDIILNAAAISDIGDCEKNPEASFAANVTLPIVLARAANKTGAKLVSFSSDQVYTGCEDIGPYSEDTDLPRPKNIYACHKLEAEQRVLDIAPDSVMLRATWMYDMPSYSHKNRGNFLMNTLNSVIKERKMSFFSCEYRGITYVRQVAELLEDVFRLSGGVYNYGSENSLNMYETARALLVALGLEEKIDVLLQEKTAVADSYQPHNLWMNCEKLKKNGIYFDTTAEGFEHCVADYGLR